MSLPAMAFKGAWVRATLILTVVFLCAVLIVPPAGAELTRVTVITDSVGAALLWDPGPLHDFSAGLDVRGYAFGCRKLVVAGCPYAAGVNPPSALDVIQQIGTDLGPIVVIDVGYNDTADTYSAGLDEVMRALLANALRPIVLSQLQLIKDTTPPDLRLPKSAHARTMNPHGRVLSFYPVALDAFDGAIPETCTPTSPHRYPIGETNVTCSATDIAGNTAVGSFEVYVSKTPRQYGKTER
jgi:hypothetical protein